jgi:hypothetical protein
MEFTNAICAQGPSKAWAYHGCVFAPRSLYRFCIPVDTSSREMSCPKYSNNPRRPLSWVITPLWSGVLPACLYSTSAPLFTGQHQSTYHGNGRSPDHGSGPYPLHGTTLTSVAILNPMSLSSLIQIRNGTKLLTRHISTYF